MESKRQHEFNMAFNYLGRLNFLLYKINEASTELDVHSWFHNTLALYREVIMDVQETEKKEWDKEILNITHLVNKHLRSRHEKVSTNLYQKLHDFEIFVRGVLRSSGIDVKLKRDMLDPEETWS